MKEATEILPVSTLRRSLSHPQEFFISLFLSHPEPVHVETV